MNKYNFKDESKALTIADKIVFVLLLIIMFASGYYVSKIETHEEVLATGSYQVPSYIDTETKTFTVIKLK